MSREILMPQTAPQVVNLGRRVNTANTVEAQALVLPQGLVDSHPTANRYAMVPGHYGNYVNSRPAVMVGAPGTTLGKGTYKSTVQASAVQHMDAVQVHAQAQGQWVSSQFAAVTFQPGAKAKYVGCRFSGTVDNSGGNPLDVVLVGCFFATPPINCTVIG